MIEKMTIESAKKYIESFPYEFNREKFLELTAYHRGFIEAYESRNAEVEKLKEKITELNNEIEPYTDENYGLSK